MLPPATKILSVAGYHIVKMFLNVWNSWHAMSAKLSIYTLVTPISIAQQLVANDTGENNDSCLLAIATPHL